MQKRFTMKPLCLLLVQAFALSAHAADTDAPSSAPAVAGGMQIVEVMGQGQTRQVQNLSKKDLAEALPGTSPLKTLAKLPGVNFQSADPFGAYEWSTRFSIRGFSQNQLGFTLDGVPLGDMSYGNNNGLHISRAISSENVGRVLVSQGAGALGTASTSNLGGTVQFYTLDPSEEQSVTFAQTLGSDRTQRTFVRADSGALASGTKFFISGTRQRTHKWKGEGPQDQDQFNAKFVHDFGDNNLSGFFNHSKRSETDYQDLSLDMVKRLGYNWDNYQPDWQRAVNAANGIFTGGVNNLDDAYYLGRGLRKDSLGGLSLDAKVTQSANVKATLYHHSNEGQGHWYTPYQASSPTMPISIRTTEYAIGRDGAIIDWGWEAGMHSLSAGFWGERSLHTLTRNFYAVTGPDDTNRFLSNPFLTKFKLEFTTTTAQFYVQDAIALAPEWKLNVGFKSPKVTINATSLVGTRAAGTITAEKSFLPQIGVNYTMSRDLEVFASAAENMRAYQPGVNGPFSQTQVAFDLSKQNIKPETSTTADLGVRFRAADLQASVAVYHADFKDRLLSVASCAGIVGCPSTFVNVGKVGTTGMEAIASWKLMRSLTWFNSLTLNESKYKSSYVDNNMLVPVDGKYVVDAPRKLFTTELAYEDNGFFARANAKYTDKRYYTYTNDASVPAFWLAELSAGYKFRTVGVIKDLTLQVNVTNLLDKQYFSTIGSNGFAASDPTGSFATLLAGAPRQFFVTLTGKL